MEIKVIKRIAFLFLTVFFIKMVLSVASVYVELDNRVVYDVIMQLEIEHESHTETIKDFSIDKKVDEVVASVAIFIPIQQLAAVWHRQNKYLYAKSHHLSVPTPPPNA